jgi:hypothetical protein
MVGSIQSAGAAAASQNTVEIRDDEFVVDAALVGELLRLPVSRVQTLMRSGGITSSCERGIGEDAGEFRLSFFYGNRRARLNTDLAGRVLRKSAIDFGDRPIPDARIRSGAENEIESSCVARRT